MVKMVHQQIKKKKNLDSYDLQYIFTKIFEFQHNKSY